MGASSKIVKIDFLLIFSVFRIEITVHFFGSLMNHERSVAALTGSAGVSPASLWVTYSVSGLNGPVDKCAQGFSFKAFKAFRLSCDQWW